jgi:hypothetical protein
MNHAIDEIKTLQFVNEQKIFEIQRINGQLNKALEVGNRMKSRLKMIYILVQSVKQTVDMKEKLEGDLYRKVNKLFLFIQREYR